MERERERTEKGAVAGKEKKFTRSNT